MTWLAKRSDEISSVTQIVQAFAIVAGVTALVIEFVIMDHRADLKSKQRVMEMAEDFQQIYATGRNIWVNSFEDSNYNASQEVNEFLRDSRKFYANLRVCLESGMCDRQVAHDLFCHSAYIHSLIQYDTIDEISGEKRIGRRTEDVFRFYFSCAAENEGYEGQVRLAPFNTPDWYDEFKPKFLKWEERIRPRKYE